MSSSGHARPGILEPARLAEGVPHEFAARSTQLTCHCVDPRDPTGCVTRPRGRLQHACYPGVFRSYGVLQMRDAIRLVEEVLNHEVAGRTVASPKFNSDFEGGAMRMLFAADYEAVYGATKAGRYSSCSPNFPVFRLLRISQAFGGRYARCAGLRSP